MAPTIRLSEEAIEKIQNGEEIIIETPCATSPIIIKKDEVENIIHILINSGAVKCDYDIQEPMLISQPQTYRFDTHYGSSGYVTIDFKKMAKAIYDAGYRKEKN